jgi:hypothetical protein
MIYKYIGRVCAYIKSFDNEVKYDSKPDEVWDSKPCHKNREYNTQGL